MDGYKVQDIIDRFEAMQHLFDVQVHLNREMASILAELDAMPEIPDLDAWISSVSDNKSFKLENFKRMFEINRQYNAIVEEKDKTASQIKVIVIDNLLDRIKDLLDKE
jgi:hypothetical protein